MLSKFGTCQTCTRRTYDPNDPTQSVCTISRQHIPNMVSDKCPWYKNKGENKVCDLCGRTSELVYYDVTDPNNIKFVCVDCLNKFGTCYVCKNSNICAFSADQSSPDYVMKQVQQGHMIAQVQVLNPDKIAIYCVKCCCWNKEEKYCYKQEIGTCGKYNEV